jgi:hypothetical protein
MSAKSVNAVVPLVVGVTLVNAPPPAEYEPELPTSLVTVYAVVAAVNDALLVYSASLNVLPVAAGEVVYALQEFLLEGRAHEVASEGHVRVSL